MSVKSNLFIQFIVFLFLKNKYRFERIEYIRRIEKYILIIPKSQVKSKKPVK
jgi:hypothetical protein